MRPQNQNSRTDNFCKICLKFQAAQEVYGKLTKPCVCPFPLGWVHTECLRNYIIQKKTGIDSSKCEICGMVYKTKVVIQEKFSRNSSQDDQKRIYSKILGVNLVSFLVFLVIIITLFVLFTVFKVHEHNEENHVESSEHSSRIIAIFIVVSGLLEGCFLSLVVFALKKIFFIIEVVQWDFEEANKADETRHPVTVDALFSHIVNRKKLKMLLGPKSEIVLRDAGTAEEQKKKFEEENKDGPNCKKVSVTIAGDGKGIKNAELSQDMVSNAVKFRAELGMYAKLQPLFEEEFDQAICYFADLGKSHQIVHSILTKLEADEKAEEEEAKKKMELRMKKQKENQLKRQKGKKAKKLNQSHQPHNTKKPQEQNTNNPQKNQCDRGVSALDSKFLVPTQKINIQEIGDNDPGPESERFKRETLSKKKPEAQEAMARTQTENPFEVFNTQKSQEIKPKKYIDLFDLFNENGNNQRDFSPFEVFPESSSGRKQEKSPQKYEGKPKIEPIAEFWEKDEQSKAAIKSKEAPEDFKVSIKSPQSEQLKKNWTFTESFNTGKSESITENNPDQANNSKGVAPLSDSIEEDDFFRVQNASQQNFLPQKREENEEDIGSYHSSDFDF